MTQVNMIINKLKPTEYLYKLTGQILPRKKSSKKSNKQLTLMS